MHTIQTLATVTEDGQLVLSVMVGLVPGRYHVVIVVDEEVLPSDQDLFDLPVHDVGPWPEGLSLRREDMYDDWGR